MVAPSAAPNEPERIRFAVDTVESLGFKVNPGAHLFDRDGYLAGFDEARAADVNAMFADDGVDAIWCVRGGYGASRILPALDYALMRRKPKALIGYSDITALHMAIHRHAGLVTFHGPVAFRAFTPYSLAELKRVLWIGEAPVRLGGPPPFERVEGRVDWENRVATLVPGTARGRADGDRLDVDPVPDPAAPRHRARRAGPRRPRRRLGTHARGTHAGRARGAVGPQRADRGRHRHRQGSRGARSPQRQPACGQAHGGAQLRRGAGPDHENRYGENNGDEEAGR
jgi:hypothetical protein